ncbi:uncharacterized protein LOC107361466 isoform X2 [Tetranychus urticae]|uniref:uncharacterized protein LOC107361466 isoform X2 n=1 Tax=Tetranychus urticae TaxID=32264 RepID=UPI00077BCA71|nr:uncharacterized protein LOC107361466 isoform X2 [Tetranychus urticae]
MDQSTDEELKIVVRKNVYYVSKKFICSVVPYFEKIFCDDLLKPKENKVELDFDEHNFDSVLNWIHCGSFLIQLEDVIDIFEVADHLMISDRLFKPCLKYFQDNFNIEHIPLFLSKVTKTTKLINLQVIDNFICRHFLLIANTNIFLQYPVETVEHILKLDLMIYSEYQVFEAIIRWVNKRTGSRKRLLPRLLNCVRWSFMDPVDVTKIKNAKLIKGLSNLDSIISPDCEYGFNRSKQNFFISIDRIDDSNLTINVFDTELFRLPIGAFTQDDSISLGFIPRENISDIVFDSGRKGIRIDWSKKTFRWLDMEGDNENRYNQLTNIIVKFLTQSGSLACYLEEKDTKPNLYSTHGVFLESVNKYIAIGKTEDEKKWCGHFPVVPPDWCYFDKKPDQSFHATILDKVVYILTEELEFIQFNHETRSFNKSYPFKGQKWSFNDLILTSQQSKDDKVILVNKSSGKIHVYLINQEKWIEKYRIMNVNFYSDSSNAPANQLIAFASTFLQTKYIKPLYKRKFCDL